MAVGSPVPLPTNPALLLVRYFNPLSEVETFEVVDGSSLTAPGDTLRRELKGRRKTKRQPGFNGTP
jgi:hypothetical protein